MKREENMIYFVTGNMHKFNEILDLFSKEHIKYNLKQKNIKTIEIQAININEVASFKLNSIKGQIDGTYFVEDAGFFVDTPLNGFPGVYSSYIIKTIGNKGLLRLIDDFENTEAHFTSVIALYFKPHDKNYFFEGKIQGKISGTIRGSGGFGFDPIFLPNVMPSMTFAELTTEEKNSISHRGMAWIKFIRFLKENMN